MSSRFTQGNSNSNQGVQPGSGSILGNQGNMDSNQSASAAAENLRNSTYGHTHSDRDNTHSGYGGHNTSSDNYGRDTSTHNTSSGMGDAGSTGNMSSNMGGNNYGRGNATSGTAHHTRHASTGGCSMSTTGTGAVDNRNIGNTGINTYGSDNATSGTAHHMHHSSAGGTSIPTMDSMSDMGSEDRGGHHDHHTTTSGVNSGAGIHAQQYHGRDGSKMIGDNDHHAHHQSMHTDAHHSEHGHPVGQDLSHSCSTCMNENQGGNLSGVDNSQRMAADMGARDKRYDTQSEKKPTMSDKIMDEFFDTSRGAEEMASMISRNDGLTNRGEERVASYPLHYRWLTLTFPIVQAGNLDTSR